MVLSMTKRIAAIRASPSIVPQELLAYGVLHTFYANHDIKVAGILHE